MKTMKSFVIITFAGLLASCVTTAKFPVSQLAPAADISVKTMKQSKPNYLVTITAKNLASSRRLSPPKNHYVIWAVSEEGATRNVGHFTQKNAEKSTYKASFPYKPAEVFITAEDEENICLPSATEISRTRLFSE